MQEKSRDVQRQRAVSHTAVTQYPSLTEDNSRAIEEAYNLLRASVLDIQNGKYAGKVEMVVNMTTGGIASCYTLTSTTKKVK